MPYTFLDVVLLLPNQTWVYLPTCSRVTLLTVGGGEEKGSVIAGCQARSPVVLVLKIPDLPEGLQGKVFKDRMREGGGGAHDPLMDIFFSLVDGEVTRSQHHQPLILRNRGPHTCRQRTVHFFHLVGVSVSTKQFKGLGSECYPYPLRKN